MNAFLHVWTTFGFEYLISFRAEHSDADRVMKESKNRLNGGEKIVSKIQSWQNKWTRFLKFSRKLAELVGRKLEMAPNRMFQQLTDKTKKKKNTVHFMKRSTRKWANFLVTESLLINGYKEICENHLTIMVPFKTVDLPQSQRYQEQRQTFVAFPWTQYHSLYWSAMQTDGHRFLWQGHLWKNNMIQ